MKTNQKLSIQLFLAIALCLFGAGLIVASMIMPPTGVIDPSVLTAFGECLTFAGSLIGIDYHYRSKEPKP